MFQSQTRSQSTGDVDVRRINRVAREVSISDEKPIHWRRLHDLFQKRQRQSFNLRREANPLATSTCSASIANTTWLQSQTTSQSTSDHAYYFSSSAEQTTLLL